MKKKYHQVNVTWDVRITKNMKFQKAAINKLCMKPKKKKSLDTCNSCHQKH